MQPSKVILWQIQLISRTVELVGFVRRKTERILVNLQQSAFYAPLVEGTKLRLCAAEDHQVQVSWQMLNKPVHQAQYFIRPIQALEIIHHEQRFPI